MGDTMQLPMSDETLSDQETVPSSRNGHERKGDERPEDVSRLNEQTSGLYETMVAFLDLPDREKSSIPIYDARWQPPDEGTTEDGAPADSDHMMRFTGLVQEPILPDTVHSCNNSGSLNLGDLQAEPDKAVRFSKLEPHPADHRNHFLSRDRTGSLLEKQPPIPLKYIALKDKEDEEVKPSRSFPGSEVQRESRPSCRDGSVPDRDWPSRSPYRTDPGNVIRFSTLGPELVSRQQLDFATEDKGLQRENQHGIVIEPKPGPAKLVSFPESMQQSNGQREASIFSETDAFPQEDQSPEAVRSAQEASEIYQSIVAFLKDTFADVSEGRLVSIDRACSIILTIANSPITRDEWSKLIDATGYSSDSKDFLLYHHANVATFSICLGITLQFSKEELCRIGIVALLHDIGKMLIPDEILFKRGQLTSEEWKVLKQYPYESYKILSALGPKYDILAQCALQVNERIDGSGFPRGLKNEAVHSYAQMIGLMDVYEAMTSNRPYRPKLLHYDAVKEILKTRKSSFARHYITALLKTFSIFPLYSCVKLNSGVIGRIIEVNKDLPMRPKVEVIYDAGNILLPVPFVVDLATQSFLYIQAPVPESELPAAT